MFAHRQDLTTCKLEEELLCLPIAYRAKDPGCLRRCDAKFHRSTFAQPFDECGKLFFRWRGKRQTQLEAPPDGAVEQLGMVGRRYDDDITR